MENQETKEVAKVNDVKGLPSAEQLTGLLAEETKRQDVLDNFINKNLKQDVDFGIIPGTKKPTLLKPGAEKVLSLFNLRPEWNKDTDTLEMIGVKGAVAYKCQLINRSSGAVVGEGRGVAIPMEKSSWNANTQVKICEKRALVDAVLSTFALSSRYTQDVEDMRPMANNQQKTPQAANPGAQGAKNWSVDPHKPASDKQKWLIRKLLEDLQLAETFVTNKAGAIDTMKMGVASQVIDQLTKKKNKAGETPKENLPTVDAETGEYREAEIVEPGV